VVGGAGRQQEERDDYPQHDQRGGRRQGDRAGIAAAFGLGSIDGMLV
jgi:hypothetical protein